jgi:multidrug resistance efflux pump
MNEETDTGKTPTDPEQKDVTAKAQPDPVRKATFVILGLCVILMAYYLIADRVTPYTTQARVHALVVPIAPEVSGTVTDVAISSNQVVDAGDLLFNVDRERYVFGVDTAQANLQSARQATGASTANVDTARAQVESARANLVRSQQDASRLRRIKEEDPGAISERRLESAESTLAIAQAQLSAAESTVEKALQDLGQTGDANVRIMQAQIALDTAQLDLANAEIRAPADGIITDVRVARGNIANAGAPLMTFLATHDIWVQADFTENNLGHIERGDEVDIVFDALPGRIIKGTVRTTGFGVQVDSAPLGSLPTIDNDRNWLRDAQRFSVLVDFEMPGARDRLGIRVGAQASVVVYADDGFLFNTIAKIKIWLVSLFTYAY